MSFLAVAAAAGATVAAPPAHAAHVEGGRPAAVLLTPSYPRTDSVLTATPVAAGEPGDGAATAHVEYRWLRNGVEVPGATGGTFDLGRAGHGDRGDVMTAQLTAGDGGADAAVLTSEPVTVGNSAPVVDAGSAPAGGTEGGDVPLAGTASDPDGDPLTTRWTLAPEAGVDPGTTCAVADPAALSTSGACTDDGAFTAELTASDGTDTASTAEAVTLANAPPVVGALWVEGGRATACTAGNEVTLRLTVADPGANDLVDGRIGWGDGTSSAFAGSPVAAGHRYGAGTHIIRVEASDDDGGARVRGSTSGAVSLQYLATGAGADGGPVLGETTLRPGSAIPLRIDVRDCDGRPVAGLQPLVALARVSPTKRAVDDVLPLVGWASGDRMSQLGRDGPYGYVLSTRRSRFASGPLTAGRYQVTVSDPSFGVLTTTVELTGGL